MADAMDTLKGLLGDDAQEKITGVINSLSAAGDTSGNSGDGEMRELIDKLGTSRSDPRAALLLSLRPYMSEGRKKSIDGAVRLLNLGKLSGLMKNL